MSYYVASIYQYRFSCAVGRSSLPSENCLCQQGCTVDTSLLQLKSVQKIQAGQLVSMKRCDGAAL